ncbi:hypothetical protein ACWD1Y_06485 [Streptomyces sp. NPDC002814]
MTVRTAWLLPTGQTREDTRLAPLGVMAPESEMRTRDGVLAGGNPFAATGAGAMDLQIGTGRAVVQGTDAQGAYPVANDAPTVLTFADGDAQFARIDSVALRVYDQLFDTQGQNLARIEIIQGSRSATPTAPTMPSACLRLWDVTVPAGASAGVGGINWSSALADRRRYTAAHGGIIPRGWGLGFDGAYDGQYRDNGSVLERWNGTTRTWETYRPPLAVDSATSGFAIASGYTLNQYVARRGNGMAWFALEVVRKGAQLDVPAAGNVAPDELIGTVPDRWRPPADVEVSVSDGFGEGTARLNTSGLLTLRTWSGGGAVRPDRNIRMSPMYFLA